MFKPIGNKICVKADERKTQTASGLYIPDTVKNEAMEGTVVSIGTGTFKRGVRKTFQLEPGNRIAFAAWGAMEITVEGEKFLLMEEENVIGILRS
jgi:chaperonin GroES